MNSAQIIGRLTQDPQATTFDSGSSCCRFTVAVNRPYSKDKDQQADFINVVAWNSLAQNCVKYIKKGSQVAVVGSIQTGSYEKDGIKRSTFEIRANSVEFLSTPQSNDSEPRATQPVQQPRKPVEHRQQSIDDLQPVDDDDMPF